MTFGEDEEGDRDQVEGDAFLAFVGVAVPKPGGELDYDQDGGAGFGTRIDAEADDGDESGQDAGCDGDDAFDDAVGDGEPGQAEASAGEAFRFPRGRVCWWRPLIGFPGCAVVGAQRPLCSLSLPAAFPPLRA